MILHFDFSTGASGDKLLGALLEVCEELDVATLEEVQHLADLLVDGLTVQRRRIDASGIAATQMQVAEEHHAPHRHWSDICAMIEETACSGELDEAACTLALRAFEAVALAEAAVHGVEAEHVHFHEVGAADSIVDIVCTSFLLTRLAPTAVYATPLALGNGTVVCAHGELPVPAPATARLVEGLPVYASAHDGELTTPTGAALARTFVTHWEPLPLVRPHACCYGAGTRVLPGAANVVRVLACELFDENDALKKSSADVLAGLALEGCVLEGCALLETNIDHLSAEALAFACEELMTAGALDVWQEPIVMKKGRLAVRLSVLASPTRGTEFAERVMALTGSLGIRRRYVERIVAPREVVVRDTPYGPVPFKVARFVDPADAGGISESAGSDVDEFAGDAAGDAAADSAGGRSGNSLSPLYWARPEHDTVARIAREQGLDYQQLYREITETYVR